MLLGRSHKEIQLAPRLTDRQGLKLGSRVLGKPLFENDSFLLSFEQCDAVIEQTELVVADAIRHSQVFKNIRGLVKKRDDQADKLS